jgi:hypothetical protein
MSTVNKFAAAIAAAKAKGPDMTKATEGGGDYTPPAAGVCRLRFVGYVEIGKHEKKFKGVAKTQTRVILTFELSGPNHPPSESGHPQLISIDENLSLNTKAGFQKLFTRMNYAGKATHMAELLGSGYLGTIYHREWKGADDKINIAAELRSKGEPYDVRPPRWDNPATGEKNIPIEIAPPVAPLRMFLWDFPEVGDTPLDQWNSLFIEGEYPARVDAAGKETRPAKSKNTLQNKIKLAKNFNGSPIHILLTAGGKVIDIPDAEQDDSPPFDADADEPAAPTVVATPTGADATDVLNGIVP